MREERTKKILAIIIPLIAALISVFFVSRFATSTDFHAKTIQALDEKKTTVMELTAAAAATSTAITFIPGDAATPLAEKIADLSSYFLLVTCAIYLEKYLVTITGYAAFMLLIPIGCVLLSLSVCLKKSAWKYLASKLIIFGLAIFLVVPASVKVSDIIENTYQSSIDKTIEDAKQTTEAIDESTEEDENGLSGIISKVTGSVSEVTAKVKNVLNNFIEALAVLIVTSCVIPIAVMLFFVWIVKSLLGVNFNLPRQKI